MRALITPLGTELEPPAANQLLLRLADQSALLVLAERLSSHQFYLVAVFSSDERQRIDHCFKLTYLFSHPGHDLFLFVENPLRQEPADMTANALPATTGSEEIEYDSLSTIFPACLPFEQEMTDLMGLRPRHLQPGCWLPTDCYPPHLYPLRRDRSPEDLGRLIANAPPGEPVAPAIPPSGEWLLPVGPVHAGVIEPGQFLFRLAGEVIEEVNIRLGYTHKGIERLFQTECTLADGWRLAERVAGDSAFAHSLAYCRAAEALADAQPTPAAEWLRGLFLELERIANHIGNCAALAHDVSFNTAATELAAIREQTMQLCQHLAGHRLLRGLNRPGGIVLPQPIDAAAARQAIGAITDDFVLVTDQLVHILPFRERLQWTGILTPAQAHCLGLTGVVARAANAGRDFRLHHATGIYRDDTIQQLIRAGLPPDDDLVRAREATAGDTLARFLLRVMEVKSAAAVADAVLHRPEIQSGQTTFLVPVHFAPERNFTFGLGYAEGWRGDVVYWLVQDKMGRIFRCKVRDPSVLNWRGLKAAVEPHDLEPAYLARHRKELPPGLQRVETLLADFPLINKSFNLSYSGYDL